MDVSTLTMEDLMQLSNEQLQMCAQVTINKANSKALQKIKEALAEEQMRMAESLTAPPYVYVSPEIKLMAGFKVRFSTLMKVQLDDAHAQLDKFINTDDPNNMRMSDFLNQQFLAHAVVSVNGADFGGVSLDASDYQQLRSTSPEQAHKVLSAARDARISALGDLSPQVYQRLIEYYQAFQKTVEAMTMDDEMMEALGN